MSKLSAYIDNMFIGLPETAEVLDAKKIIQENMTEKYEDLISQGKNEAEAFGTVAGEFGSMEELCEEMGWDFSRGTQGSFHTNAQSEGAVSGNNGTLGDAARSAVDAAEEAVGDSVGSLKSWWKSWNTRENRGILLKLIVRFIVATIIIAVLSGLMRDSLAALLLICAGVLFVSFYSKSPLYVYKDRVAKEEAEKAAQEAARQEAQAVAAAVAAAGSGEKEQTE